MTRLISLWTPLEQCKLPRQIRSYGSWGMGGIWDRLKNGLSRTDSVIQKIRAGKNAQVSDKKKETTPNGSAGTTADQISSPWETIKRYQELRKQALPPEVLWMQSSFVRGSTLKLTMMARQIIGSPLDAALLQMHFSKRKMAELVESLLQQMKTSLIRSRANPAHFFVKSASVGRGKYIKRPDIRARGKCGIENRGHAFIRICLYKPDPEALVKKMLKIKIIPREDRPISKKLDYY